MYLEISDIQKRRADNIIWSCAKDYSFAPDFKAYNSNGNIDLYWNIIYGSTRRHYEYKEFEKLFSMLDKYRNAEFYQTIFWDSLEQIVFQKELAERPVLKKLRPDSKTPEIKFSIDMDACEIVKTAKSYFYDNYGLYGDGKVRLKYILPHLKRMSVDSFLQRGRVIIHEKDLYNGNISISSDDYNLITKLTTSELREFLESKFGRSVYSPNQTITLEKLLCNGNHKFTHLLFTNGDIKELTGIYNTFEMHQRKRQSEIIENNRIYYDKHSKKNRLQILKLSINIMNSVLMHLQPYKSKANSGNINPSTVWRGSKLNDNKIFTKVANQDSGDISVDILLDASHSQISRAEKISSQAYIIAEALSRCNIPSRVLSFCSMSGFTIIKMFNDYSINTDNSAIFNYYAEGCSRDGLAIRAVGHLISESSYHHKILIILSDVKPLDVVNIKKDERDHGTSYDELHALKDTAFEVRKLKSQDISVICIFTGEDEDIPSAKLVYGQDFVRIRDYDQFADTVGKLISEQIKYYSS